MDEMIKVAVPITGDEEVSAVRDVILSGGFVSGKNVEAFEQKFSSYIGASNACAVNSGTAALHVALSVLGIGPGDEVIVPPLTFMSTVTSVLHQNAIPIFADIDKVNFCISPTDIRKRITDRTKAIIPVHLFGNAAAMDEIMEIAEENNLFVIEDCAQAHGTEYQGQKVGSIGHMGVFSFFATKHMTTGEGGLIASNNKDWIEKSKQIRSHGMIGRDDHIVLGYNYRMNEMAGAMGLVQLSKLDRLNRTRIDNSMIILNELAQDTDKWYRTPALSDEVLHTFFWCPLIIDKPNGPTIKSVIKELQAKGIEVRNRYQEPLYKQKIFQDISSYPKGCPFTCDYYRKTPGYGNLSLPNVESIAGKIIGLPNHPKLTKIEIRYIIDTIKNLF